MVEQLEVRAPFSRTASACVSSASFPCRLSTVLPTLPIMCPPVARAQVGVPLYALEYCEKFKLVYASGNGVIAIFKARRERFLLPF